MESKYDLTTEIQRHEGFTPFSTCTDRHPGRSAPRQVRGSKKVNLQTLLNFENTLWHQ